MVAPKATLNFINFMKVAAVAYKQENYSGIYHFYISVFC